MFRLVVDRKYLDAKTLDILNLHPIMLPPWDPMFSEDID
ncbi:MAG: C1 family peptidase [Bacteroidales bacterium]|nr:C1 family peptidase [Bacteroidales bacterium]